MSTRDVFVSAIVLAAGASRRLRQPKQLLPFRGATLLDATLEMARDCRFDQLIVALGGAGDAVRGQVDLRGAEVVQNPQFASGCGSSLSVAMGVLDPRCDGVVLLLGDQPDVSVGSVDALITLGGPIAVCRYSDGLGHPFWFGREMFAELAGLHGDKAVWKLIDSGRFALAELSVAGPAPRDVDTWDDYVALLGTQARTR